MIWLDWLSIVAIVLCLILSFVFAVLGFVLLFIGYRLFDMLTPTDLNKRIRYLSPEIT